MGQQIRMQLFAVLFYYSSYRLYELHIFRKTPTRRVATRLGTIRRRARWNARGLTTRGRRARRTSTRLDTCGRREGELGALSLGSTLLEGRGFSKDMEVVVQCFTTGGYLYENQSLHCRGREILTVFLIGMRKFYHLIGLRQLLTT
jgi:hypothetical protein